MGRGAWCCRVSAITHVQIHTARWAEAGGSGGAAKETGKGWKREHDERYCNVQLKGEGGEERVMRSKSKARRIAEISRVATPLRVDSLHPTLLPYALCALVKPPCYPHLNRHNGQNEESEQQPRVGVSLYLARFLIPPPFSSFAVPHSTPSPSPSPSLSLSLPLHAYVASPSLPLIKLYISLLTFITAFLASSLRASASPYRAPPL